MRLRTWLIAAACVPTICAAQQAEFCHIGQYSSSMNCSYPSMSLCQSAVSTMGGTCVIRGKQEAQPTNVFDSFQRGVLAGAQARQAKASARLLEAQAAQLESRAPRVEYNGEVRGYWVLYRCPTSTGEWTFTGEPAVGCVVDIVTSY